MRASWPAECTTLSMIIWLAIAPTSFSSTEASNSEPLASNYGLAYFARNDDDQSARSITGIISEQLSNDRVKRRAKLPSNLMPEFAASIGNVTAVLGRDVRLICTVDNLGQYQVAWLREETKTILSIDTNIIITNYRIFLIPDEEERKWVLHIKDVQESDRGFYQCQVNTNPMRSMTGHLEVVVPPSIIENQSSQVAELLEHADVAFQCKANGHPKPSIIWRRDDGNPIQLSGNFPQSGLKNESSLSQMLEVRSDRLTLHDVDRSMGGIYICTASNGIPTSVSKRIPLYVKFVPKTSVQSGHVSVELGQQLQIDCLIEAHPKANSYWSKRAREGASSRQQATSDWHRLVEPSLAQRGATSPARKQPIDQLASGHPHSRPHVRHLQDGDTASVSSRATKLELPTEGKAYVTVKQTALNAYTYNLRLTIARVQVEDLGEYSCVASNSMGTSESHVFVARVDKPKDAQSPEAQLPRYSQHLDDEEPTKNPGGDFQRDSLADTRRSTPSIGSNRVVVYDENYLQAIKDRQGIAGILRHQRLKYKSASDQRNGTPYGRPVSSTLLGLCAVVATILVSCLHRNLYSDPMCDTWPQAGLAGCE